CVRGYYFDYW
nr:immunoglobulin heavy chain junction region [Mus musculus]MBK4188118.1 immunoglobulin heavy chain junction region [Mus musculus]MBK4189812.1 immunoglobulin heavy chain junction region [Mus musculus]MBK4189813.1 immunoglobulin heavy chain junction region [Mus musculus]MBK4189814.1 immunoglobulin heavy chain junction region [Mus musculus]